MFIANQEHSCKKIYLADMNEAYRWPPSTHSLLVPPIETLKMTIFGIRSSQHFRMVPSPLPPSVGVTGRIPSNSPTKVTKCV